MGDKCLEMAEVDEMNDQLSLDNSSVFSFVSSQSIATIAVVHNMMLPTIRKRALPNEFTSRRNG